MAFTILSASNSVGLKIFGLSAPLPHSAPVKVSTVKWQKAYISRSACFTWAGVGVAP